MQDPSDYRFLGLENVLISDFSKERYNAGLNFGATAVVNQGGEHISEQILDLLSGSPTLLFGCIGLPGTLQMATDYAGPSALLVVVGFCIQSVHYFPTKAL